MRFFFLQNEREENSSSSSRSLVSNVATLVNKANILSGEEENDDDDDVLEFYSRLFFLIKMAHNNPSGAAKDAADQNFDYMFKLLIIGNSSVGKTSFVGDEEISFSL